MKAYKIKISGSYRTTNNEVIDYNNVEGFIPAVADVEFAEAMIRKRYAPMWITESKEYSSRVLSVRECYIDVFEKAEHEFSFVGKKIEELTYGELQDLATAKGLRAIPQYKKGGLRQAQSVAYMEYANKIMGQDVDNKKKGYNFMKLPTIVVSGELVANIANTFSNDEIIQREMESNDARAGAKATTTRSDLEKTAFEKGITYHPNISDEKLYARIYNS